MEPPEPRGMAPDGVGALQPERTRLAWRRTALAVTVVMLLLARLTVATDEMSAADVVALGLVASAWLTTQLVAQGRVRAVRQPQPAPVAGALPALIGFVVAALAVIGVVLVWR